MIRLEGCAHPAHVSETARAHVNYLPFGDDYAGVAPQSGLMAPFEITWAMALRAVNHEGPDRPFGALGAQEATPDGVTCTKLYDS